MTNDVWATAGQTPASTPMTDQASDLADSYADEPSGLFGGGEGAGPSLLNKTHPVGTSRTGIVTKPPTSRHSTTVKGEPKYWQEGSNKPVTDAVNPITGKPNRPVKDTVIALDTEYEMTADEAMALNREEPYAGTNRSITLSGDKLKAFKKAMFAYNAANPAAPLTSDRDLVGKRITETRVAQKPNPNGGDPIKIHEYEITNA